MSVSSDSAEQIVKMSLDGTEVALRIAGDGAEKLGTLLFAILKDNMPEHTSGRAWLKKAMQDGRGVSFFEIPPEDLKRFTAQAKQYGVHYYAIRNKDDADAPAELLVDSNDALKVNHIIEKFKLAAVVESSAEQQAEEAPEIEPVREKTDDEKILEGAKVKQENPTRARAENEGLSENTSGERSSTERNRNRKPSVRQRLREMAAERQRAQQAAEKAGQTLEHAAELAPKSHDDLGR